MNPVTTQKIIENHHVVERQLSDSVAYQLKIVKWVVTG